MSDPRADARSLRSLIESEADATDGALTLTPPLVDAFVRTRLFQLMIPQELGGLEADSDTILDVFEELAHADGSVGWTLMANAAASAYVCFLDPDAAAKMVSSGPDFCAAGQFSPFASVAREDGGYRVSGDFHFGSGVAHARFVGGAGFLLGGDGAPETLEDGMPAWLCFFVPRDGIELQGNWDVLGLRGTGSFDYAVREQHVDAGATFWLHSAGVRSGGALYRIGPVPLAGLGHAGWGLGVAQRALDEVAEIAAGGRARMGQAPLADQPTFQRELGRHLLALQSVRLLVHDVFGRCIERLAAGEPMSPAAAQRCVAATTYLTQVTEDATLFAYRQAGSQGLRNPSTVQRCFRDVFTGGRHVFVDPRCYEEIAKTKLGAL